MKECNTISGRIAETITSKYNQNVTMITVGSMGSGKSFANLKIAYEASKKVADIIGGRPEDYFSLDHVAIINLNDVLNILENTEKYGIYIIDDIGVGWNARKFATELNILLNDIFQTFRTENTAIMITVPDTLLIDRVPKSLVQFYMEMELSIFEKGITIGKFFETVRKHRRDKLFYTYPVQDGTQYVRYVFEAPPEHLIIPYEEKRRSMAVEMKKEKIQKYREKHERETTKQQVESKRGYVAVVDRLREDGYAVQEACNMVNISKQYYYDIKGGRV